MWLWTFVIAGGLIYVFFVSGQLFAITEQAMILLGFAGGGSLGARFTAMRRQERAVRTVGVLAAAPVTIDPRPSDLVVTAGQVDIFKFQMLIFTLVTAGYVLFRVAADHAFPAVPDSLLLLMGISNGAYVGGKMAGSRVFERLESNTLDLELLKGRQKKIESAIDKLNETIGEEKEKRTKQQEDLKKAEDAHEDTAELEIQIAALDHGIEALEDRLNDRETELAGITKGIGDLKGEVEELIAKVTAKAD